MHPIVSVTGYFGQDEASIGHIGLSDGVGVKNLRREAQEQCRRLWGLKPKRLCLSLVIAHDGNVDIKSESYRSAKLRSRCKEEELAFVWVA